MLQIQPENDPQALKVLCRTAGVTYTEDLRGAVMRDGEIQLGYALFTCGQGYAVIHALAPVDDLALADGILRSTIHMALRSGCLSVYYADTAPEAVFIRLGFVMHKAEKQLHTHKLFDTCGGCK